MLYEVKRAAEAVAAVLRVEADAAPEPTYELPTHVEPTYVEPTYAEPAYAEAAVAEPAVAAIADAVVAEPVGTYAPPASDATWPSYLPNGNGSVEPPAWS